MQDVVDVVYDVLLEQVTRQALNARIEFAVYNASGRFEMDENSVPTIDEAQRRLDEALEAEPETTVEDPRDRELLALMMGRV